MFLKLFPNCIANKAFLATILLSFIFVRNLLSVVNTEDLRQNLDSSGVYNSAEINFGLRSGNVNFNSLGATYRFDLISKETKSFLIGSLNYKDNNDNLIDRNGFLHLRNQIFKNMLLKPEFFVQAEFDEFRNLKERYLIGSNLRMDHSFLDSSKNKLRIAIGTGIMYEEEHLKESSSYYSYIWRHTNYITLDIDITETLDLRTVTYFQYDVINVNDFRVLNESVLLFSVNNFLQISISLAYRYDNQPAQNTIHYDSMIKNGLRIRF